MLRITIPSAEFWDEQKCEFVTTPERTLQLEHSLVSISKWESKWNKVFLSKREKTREETTDYIRCMTITQNVAPLVYYGLSDENYAAIDDYIRASMTATYFSEEGSKGSGSKEEITSELIYYWMVTFNIPMECQKWHLNRLLTLIRICDIKNRPTKKRSRREIIQRNKRLNAERKKRLNSRG